MEHDVSSSDCSESSSLESPVFSEITSDSSIDIDMFLGPECHHSPPSLETYRLVGDNIDKDIKPRNMTSEHQTQSLHYFHMYAVKDRVDLSGYSNEVPQPDSDHMNLETLLPGRDDVKMLHDNFALLVGWVLRKYMPFFEKFGIGLGRHIYHEHSDAMSAKSEVVCRTNVLEKSIACINMAILLQVPLGIILKSEQKNEDMIEILEELQKYVPTQTHCERVKVTGEESIKEVCVDEFHQLEIGMKQMV